MPPTTRSKATRAAADPAAAAAAEAEAERLAASEAAAEWNARLGGGAGSRKKPVSAKAETAAPSRRKK